MGRAYVAGIVIGLAGVVAAACGNVAQPAPPCPNEAPANGAPCSNFPLECEYGTARDINCNVVAACVPEPNKYPLGNAKWQVSGPTSACVTTSSPGCPDRGSTPAFTSCDACGAVPFGGVCFYSDAECGCVNAYMECSPMWVCSDPAAGCPTPRPNLGSACHVADSLACAYGVAQSGYGFSIYGPSGMTLHCIGGTWQR